MEEIWEGCYRLTLFAAVAGFFQMLMPKGKARSCAETLLGLLAVKWILDIAKAALSALPA